MDESLPDQVFRTRRFSLGAPADFTVTGDGAAVLFRRGGPGPADEPGLWSLDLATGAERLLAGPADVGGAITGYAADAAGALAAFTVDGSLWTAGGSGLRRWPAEQAEDPRPDPAGAAIAYRSGGELRLIDDAGDRVLLRPEHPDVRYGVVGLAGRGCWWAPDGQRLLVARTDARDVPLWQLGDPAEPERPPRGYRYPAVGRANPDVSLWVVGRDGVRTEVGWDRAGFEYVLQAGWDALVPHSSPTLIDFGSFRVDRQYAHQDGSGGLWTAADACGQTGDRPHVAVQSRDQRTVRFLVIDPDSGATDVLHEQTDACWVQPIPGLPARTASGALLGHVDDGDSRHLTVNGTRVTPAGVVLHRVLAVDGEHVLFAASADPVESQLWLHHPDTGAVALTDGPALHEGTRRNGVLVRVRRGGEHPAPEVTVSRAGHEPVRVAGCVPDPVLAVRATPLVLGPRRLRAVLYLPSGHRVGERLPVLLDPYGGAGSQRVTAALEWRGLVAQWFAEQGFAVLVADGAGTPGRGPVWEREVRGDVFGPVLADQVDALHAAAERFPELDLRRVGIRGWSFGGSLALAAVLRRPDVFHAAVAGAGVTDQHLYNAYWRERFLGQPDEHPDWYAAGDLVAEAPRLSRPLQLIHGLTDDNVHPANSLRFARALRDAGRPHELIVLPGIGHDAFGSPRTAELLTRQAAFLRRHLGAG